MIAIFSICSPLPTYSCGSSARPARSALLNDRGSGLRADLIQAFPQTDHIDTLFLQQPEEPVRQYALIEKAMHQAAEIRSLARTVASLTAAGRIVCRIPDHGRQ